MADEIDRGNETAELFLAAALSVQLAKGAALKPSNGHCFHCDTPIGGARWCDEDCREDWEKALRLRAANPPVSDDEG